MLNLCLYKHQPLVQASLSLLMDSTRARANLLEDLKEVQLISSWNHENMYFELEKDLRKLDYLAETYGKLLHIFPQATTRLLSPFASSCLKRPLSCMSISRIVRVVERTCICIREEEVNRCASDSPDHNGIHEREGVAI